MQRQRDELVPIGDAPLRYGRTRESDPRRCAPGAALLHCWPIKVNLLVGASEANPDLGFMARMMVLCSLPRTNRCRST